jgi:DNA polymerase-4
VILHADLDSFFASVEQRDSPRLRGRPVAVGGGVVLAASYQAKGCGVRTAMSLREARRCCPQLEVVPPRFEAYSAASDEVFAVFRDTTPVVEPLSIDEAFLDVGGLQRLAGAPEDIARRLRADVAARVGLPITVGVARTKFLAKVASRVAKPDGLLVVDPEQELAFLHPLPVEAVWGIGRVTADKLHQRGIRTVAELAAVDKHAVIAMLGRASGRQVYALARNEDPRPVQPGRRRRSIGSQRALGSGPHAAGDVDASLTALVDRVTRRLRRAARTARTVVLRLRFADFTRATRSHTLAAPTDDTEVLLRAARTLLATAAPLIASRGITLVGVSLTGLDGDAGVQLELPFTVRDTTRLNLTLDGIRDRFGATALTRATLLGRDTGFSMPTLPD